MNTLTRLILILFLALGLSSDAASSVEMRTGELVKEPDVTVVHLSAPWCSNCQAELKSGGWAKTIKHNPETKFVFVSIWNGGTAGLGC